MTLDVHALVGLGRVSAFDLSPDGSCLAVEVGRADEDAARYRSNLWRVSPGVEPEEVAQGAFHDSTPRFRSDGALLFLSDRTSPTHGAEDRADKNTWRQVWALLPDGQLECLTDEPLGVEDFQISETHRLVLKARRLPGVAPALQRASAEERRQKGPSLLHYRSMPVRFWDHWLGDARVHFICQEPDGETRDLTPGADREYETNSDFDLSADGRTLVLTHSVPGPLRFWMAHLEVHDLDTGTRNHFGKHPEHSFGSPRISPDGQSIAAGRIQVDASGLGRHHVHIVDRQTGAGRDIATRFDAWPWPIAWLDEHTVLCRADLAGSVPFFAIDTRDGSVTRLSEEPGTHAGVLVRGDRIWSIHHTLLDPPEVCSTPVQGGPLTRHTALAGVDRSTLGAFAEVEHQHIPTTDGLSMPMFVLRPTNQTGRRPALLWIHGGPRGQWGETWHWRWNALLAVARGYVVALPNPRGSTGLGQAWLDGISPNQFGAQCYEDVMAGADALMARQDVDPERVCAMGGSFGGYMTNWIGTQTDHFRCLITHASLYSFHQFGFTTDNPAWWRIEVGDPWTDRVSHERYSPDAHARAWTTPTLVIHGDKDYRVPVTESLALFETLERQGVEAELAIFPDENHWILKPRNIVAWYALIFDYLERHLG